MIYEGTTGIQASTSLAVRYYSGGALLQNFTKEASICKAQPGQKQYRSLSRPGALNKSGEISLSALVPGNRKRGRGRRRLRDYLMFSYMPVSLTSGPKLRSLRVRRWIRALRSRNSTKPKLRRRDFITSGYCPHPYLRSRHSLWCGNLSAPEQAF